MDRTDPKKAAKDVSWACAGAASAGVPQESELAGPVPLISSICLSSPPGSIAALSTLPLALRTLLISLVALVCCANGGHLGTTWGQFDTLATAP